MIHGDTLAREIEAEYSAEYQDGRMGIGKIDRWLRLPETVFSRVTPSQKQLIVEVYQRMGHTVAFLGDGMNDIPAM